MVNGQKKSIITKNSTDEIKMLYTNADQLRNKMYEFKALVTNINPDIIGVTEIRPKRTTFTLNPSEIYLKG